MRVVVIGAGLGGLSAAAHLTGSGYDVTVVERAPKPGGRVGSVTEAGFRLDDGPAMITMPSVLADTFAAAGADLVDLVRLRPVEPMYRAVFPDGSTLQVRRDRAEMAAEIRAFASAKDAEGFEHFHDWLARLQRIATPHLIDSDAASARELARSWRATTRLVRMGAASRLAKKLASFFDDERLRHLFGFRALQAGVAPHQALALHAVLAHLDVIEGVHVPEGGMHSLGDGLARAVTKAGVRIRYGTPVTRILRAGDGSVSGVELGGSDRLVADAVVCTADLPVAYKRLLGGVDAPRVARRGTYAPSCLLWIAGVDGVPPPDAAHHNLHIGADWAASSRALTHDGVRMPDPSIQVSVASLDDPSLAPSGCSTLYVSESTPNLDGRIDWSRQRERIADDLRARVRALGYPTDAKIERLYDPLDWEAMGMERGTPFGLAQTPRQTGPLRPRNVDKRVPGLVFTGSSTVPGAGVPMVLVSGRLAARRVERYARETAVVRW